MRWGDSPDDRVGCRHRQLHVGCEEEPCSSCDEGAKHAIHQDLGLILEEFAVRDSFTHCVGDAASEEQCAQKLHATSVQRECCHRVLLVVRRPCSAIAEHIMSNHTSKIPARTVAWNNVNVLEPTDVANAFATSLAPIP